MEINYKTTKADFLKSYLELVNCFFNLAKTELEVLTIFVELYIRGGMNDDAMKQAFSQEARLLITERMEFKGRVNVDQYITRLKRRKAIVDNNGLTLHPILIPKGDTLTFKFIVE